LQQVAPLQKKDNVVARISKAWLVTGSKKIVGVYEQRKPGFTGVTQAGFNDASGY
jgi:hypothetical protein